MGLLSFRTDSRLAASSFGQSKADLQSVDASTVTRTEPTATISSCPSRILDHGASQRPACQYKQETISSEFEKHAAEE